MAINLPEPSGSSPALKPPGNITILACLMATSNSSIESLSICSVLFLIKTNWTLAPAFSKARFESYSQLVPGNTGITTRGVSTVTFGLRSDLVLQAATLILLVGAFSLVGYTFSRGALLIA